MGGSFLGSSLAMFSDALDHRMPLPESRKGRLNTAMNVEIVKARGAMLRLREHDSTALTLGEGDGVRFGREGETQRLARIAVADPAHQRIGFRRVGRRKLQNPATRPAPVLLHIAARLVYTNRRLLSRMFVPQAAKLLRGR